MLREAASYLTTRLWACHQAIPPLEFMLNGERIGLAFVEAVVHPPAVSKTSVCREMRVFPAECRGRRCSYKGKMVVSDVGAAAQ